MRKISVLKAAVAASAVSFVAGSLTAAPPALADPGAPPCDVPACTPGIMPNVVLGAPCSSTTHYVFGVTDWGRLVFCGSPRRYEPRWFRSPEMHGVKEENSKCASHDGEVAQAPDGLFLTCIADGETLWRRGDTYGQKQP
ncbi:hypothetical protein H7J77_16235 [Mycolicibacillus parakoreensis]|uniref:Secreted protein n=1 Tax=Mycolicibacillus parakoreensis TaxID=1069221 RepID=A0ABY3TUN0_9MYCO|nr:hypothetical protein [Mycolicibacillus parakoreensis]MCV7317088.1 hypothetical protein [Mycolicibacillus parakoreensis]ULN51412.1 hypothetical protein MIU77_10830 [Mycolicibacillus parakoreensis]